MKARVILQSHRMAVVEPPWSEYRAWAEASGIRLFSEIEVANLPEPFGRGVVAKEDVPAGRVVMTIPTSVLLSVHTIEDPSHPLHPMLALREELELREDDIIACTLMFEKAVAVRCSLTLCVTLAALQRLAGASTAVDSPCVSVAAGTCIEVVAPHLLPAGAHEQRVLLQRGRHDRSHWVRRRCRVRLTPWCVSALAVGCSHTSCLWCRRRSNLCGLAQTMQQQVRPVAVLHTPACADRSTQRACR